MAKDLGGALSRVRDRFGPVPGTRWHIALSIVGYAFAALAIAGLVGFHTDNSSHLIIVLGAASLVLQLAAVPAVLLLLVSRRLIPLVLSALLCVLCLVTVAPLVVGRRVPAGYRLQLTVMTANLRLGQASGESLVGVVRKQHVQVLMLQELTPQARDRLAAAGLDALLGYHIVDARDGADGVGLWSSVPLLDARRIPGFTFALVSARLSIPGAADEPTVISTHLPGPWPQPAEDWAADITRMRGLLADTAAAAPGQPILVGGDFNATWGTAAFRRLLTGGYHDAAEQSGGGLTRTYPADTWYPPLVGIDHVLTRFAVATQMRTVSVSGSDHRGVIAAIRLPALVQK